MGRIRATRVELVVEREGASASWVESEEVACGRVRTRHLAAELPGLARQLDRAVAGSAQGPARDYQGRPSRNRALVGGPVRGDLSLGHDEGGADAAVGCEHVEDERHVRGPACT